MSDVVVDDVMAVALAFGRRKWHILKPLCTCYAGCYQCKGGRVEATYHVPTGRFSRADGVELWDTDICKACRRALVRQLEYQVWKQWRRDNHIDVVGPKERAAFARWRLEQTNPLSAAS